MKCLRYLNLCTNIELKCLNPIEMSVNYGTDSRRSYDSGQQGPSQWQLGLQPGAGSRIQHPTDNNNNNNNNINNNNNNNNNNRLYN